MSNILIRNSLELSAIMFGLSITFELERRMWPDGEGPNSAECLTLLRRIVEMHPSKDVTLVAYLASAKEAVDGMLESLCECENKVGDANANVH